MRKITLVSIILLMIIMLLAVLTTNQASRLEVSKTQVSYKSVLQKLDNHKKALQVRYANAKSSSDKKKIILIARERLVGEILKSIIPSWYGTLWAYEGTTQTPRQGEIACGYFVTTVLKHSGLGLNRVKLAQLASETMISIINKKRAIKRFRNLPLGKFINQVKDWGNGLYLVGLDNHTGFISNEKGKIYFIHSSYLLPFGVVKELASNSYILRNSRYRVLGKLFTDDLSVLAWLNSN